jgi:O-antigen ligase
LCNETLTPLKRAALVAVALAAMGRSLVLALSWTSGWLPSLATIGVVAFLRFPKLTLMIAVLAITPVAAVGGTVYNNLATGESYSSMTRLEAAWVMLDMIQRSPWLGFGPANYYHYTLLFPLIGWWVRFNSHNNYLDLLAQVGIIGLIVFFWLSGELFRLTFWLRRRLPANGFAGAYVVGAIGGLVGTLISGALADWIVPFTYNIGLTGFRSSLLFWFFMGGLLALKRFEATAQLAAATRTPVHGSAVTRSQSNPRRARARPY